MTALEIRPAALADVPAVVALWREVVDCHVAICSEFTPTPNADALHAEHLVKGLERDDRVVFLALHSGTPAGFVAMRGAPLPPVFMGRRVAELTDLGVTRALRRKGIGRALWQQALAWARAKGFEQIELGVLAGNDAGHAFWTGIGFEPKFAHMKFVV